MSIYRQTNGSSIFSMALAAAAIVGFTPIFPPALGYPLLTLLSLIVIVPNLNKLLKRPNSLLLTCVCLYVSWGFLYSLLHISDGYGTIIQQMQFFFCILLMILMPTVLSRRHRFGILALMLLVVSLNIIDNIRLCILYPAIAASVNRSMEMVELIGQKINIGGSSWYNGLTFFFIVCFFTFLNAEKKKYKFIMLGCSLLAGLFIFGFCLKAAVIVYTVMAVVLLYFAKRSVKNEVYLIVIIIVFTFVSLLVNLYSNEIIRFLADNIESKRLSYRLISLVDNDSEQIGTVNARTRLWMLSLNTWLDNPLAFIFGIGDHVAEYKIDGMGIGHHSDFFDVPARYGLIGLLLMYQILRLGLKRILCFFDKQYHLQLYIIITIFILFGFSKSVFTPSVGCSMFLFLPLSSFFLRKANMGK